MTVLGVVKLHSHYNTVLLTSLAEPEGGLHIYIDIDVKIKKATHMQGRSHD